MAIFYIQFAIASLFPVILLYLLNCQISLLTHRRGFGTSWRTGDKPACLLRTATEGSDLQTLLQLDV